MTPSASESTPAIDSTPSLPPPLHLRAALGVFLILFASYAFFWHSRDWNTASRLMLTYALVDRGTIRLDGLDRQTGDIARFMDHYYCDKLPGYSMLATAPYALARLAFSLPPHPLNGPALRYWAADYWATLGVSGLAGAAAGALLVLLAGQLGCGPRRSALLGLTYGLATPAYVYSTLSYGHQAAAASLLGATWILVGSPRPISQPRAFLAGALAALAPAIELQVAPMAAVVSFALLLRILRRETPVTRLISFILGALGPTLFVLLYNTLAFGSPFDMGYFHHATQQFAEVHSADNPLGLRAPRWDRASSLLWGRYRGLAFYAPIVLLAPLGWCLLAARRAWATLIVSLGACLSALLVNLSYPEWTGGWSTGPRLLVSALPFAVWPVAAVLASVRLRHLATLTATLLTLAGGLLMLLFQGAGGRYLQDLTDPLVQSVWPAWTGAPLPPWSLGSQFDRNAVEVLAPSWVSSLAPSQQWLQFLPLIAAQLILIASLFLWLGRQSSSRQSTHPSRD